MTQDIPLVEVADASVHFGDLAALSHVSLTIRPGEKVALLGASGAGKSTLLRVINGAQPVTSGTVHHFGLDLSRSSTRVHRRSQARIGTVTQSLDLVRELRVLHNVQAGLYPRWSLPRALGSFLWPRPDPAVTRALGLVGLGWATHELTANLSGGEQQRVAIARTMVQDPDVLVADEPVSSLDPALATDVMALLCAAPRRDGGPTRATVMSLHQPEYAHRFCSRAIGLREGRVVFDVPVDELDDHHLDLVYASAES